jgi:hypothetical protein
MLEEVQALAVKAHASVYGPPGVTCLRAFMRGEPDPMTHMGPPTKPKMGNSLRYALYGQPADSPEEDEQSV